MKTNTHFLVVWDCDAASDAETLRQELAGGASVTPFAFKKRDNQIAQRGIENNYDEEILEPFSLKKVDNDGKVLGREFRKGCKTRFANHVFQDGTAEYFVHFEDLAVLVRRILASACRPGSTTGREP